MADDPSRITISTSSLSAMLSYAVRYALGRSSYAVYEVTEMCRHYWPHVSDEMKTIIRQDITRRIAEAEGRGGFVGMEMDHKAWKQLSKDIE